MNEFFVGEKVRKVGGTYQAEGTIIAVATTSLGHIRYVFEFDAYPGMLHIFNGGQLELLAAPNRTVVRGAVPE